MSADKATTALLPIATADLADVRLRKIEGLTSSATSDRYPTPTGRVPAAPSSDELARLTDETGDLSRDVADRSGIDLT